KCDTAGPRPTKVAATKRRRLIGRATVRVGPALIRWREGRAPGLNGGARLPPQAAARTERSFLGDGRGDAVQGERVQRLGAFVLGPQVTGAQRDRPDQPGQGRAVRVDVPDPDLGLFPYR